MRDEKAVLCLLSSNLCVVLELELEVFFALLGVIVSFRSVFKISYVGTALLKFKRACSSRLTSRMRFQVSFIRLATEVLFRNFWAS